MSGWATAARARPPGNGSRTPVSRPFSLSGRPLPQNLATARKTGHTAILWGFDGALRVRVGVDGGDGHGFLAVGGADLADAQGNLTDLRSKSNCIAMGAIPSTLIASCCHWTLIG